LEIRPINQIGMAIPIKFNPRALPGKRHSEPK
jgi:hypothetical protein